MDELSNYSTAGLFARCMYCDVLLNLTSRWTFSTLHKSLQVAFVFFSRHLLFIAVFGTESHVLLGFSLKKDFSTFRKIYRIIRCFLISQSEYEGARLIEIAGISYNITDCKNPEFSNLKQQHGENITNLLLCVILCDYACFWSCCVLLLLYGNYV